MFSDIIGGRQYRWTEADGISDFRRPSNQTNGNCFDCEGRILSCEYASSQVVRHEHDGKLVRPVATHYQGRELNSPNDIIVDAKGRIWFTDPAFGRAREELGVLRDQELDFQGVYRLDPDGSLTLVAEDFQAPNGLSFSLDETQLYVNDSLRSHIRLFDINANGSLSGGDVWTMVEGDQPPEFRYVPDGMILGTNGHLFCNGPGWGASLFERRQMPWYNFVSRKECKFLLWWGGTRLALCNSFDPLVSHQNSNDRPTNDSRMRSYFQ